MKVPFTKAELRAYLKGCGRVLIRRYTNASDEIPAAESTEYQVLDVQPDRVVVRHRYTTADGQLASAVYGIDFAMIYEVERVA